MIYWLMGIGLAICFGISMAKLIINGREPAEVTAVHEPGLLFELLAETLGGTLVLGFGVRSLMWVFGVFFCLIFASQGWMSLRENWKAITGSKGAFTGWPDLLWYFGHDSGTTEQMTWQANFILLVGSVVFAAVIFVFRPL